MMELTPEEQRANDAANRFADKQMIIDKRLDGVLRRLNIPFRQWPVHLLLSAANILSGWDKSLENRGTEAEIRTALREGPTDRESEFMDLGEKLIRRGPGDLGDFLGLLAMELRKMLAHAKAEEDLQEAAKGK